MMRKVYFIIISSLLLCIYTIHGETPIEVSAIQYDRTPIVFNDINATHDILPRLPATAQILTQDHQEISENIIWDISSIDWNTSARYKITGQLENATRYMNLPPITLFVDLQVDEGDESKSILTLEVVETTPHQITMKYIDYENDYTIDLSHLKVWMAKFKDYQENETWYHVTQHPDITVTSHLLTISNIDFSIDSTHQLKLQLSYDHPEFELYSGVYRLYPYEDKILLRYERSGDRNGGNREENPQFIFPDSQPTQPSHEKEPDIVSEETSDITETTQKPDASKTKDPIQQVEIIPPLVTHEKSVNIPQQTQPIQKDRSIKNIVSSYNTQYTSQQKTSSHPIPQSSQKPTKTDTHQPPISAKELKIPSHIDPSIPLFLIIGISLGILTIKRIKYHEKT